MSAAEPRRSTPAPEERIDEAVEESFPASDPPAFQAGATIGAPNHQPVARPRHTPVIALVAVAVVLALLWVVLG